MPVVVLLVWVDWWVVASVMRVVYHGLAWCSGRMEITLVLLWWFFLFCFVFLLCQWHIERREG